MPRRDEPRDDVVISWAEPQGVRVTQPPLPAVAAIGLKPDKLTDRGRRIYDLAQGEWYEHLHRRLKRLAAAALRRHGAARVVTTLALGWETALAETALGQGVPLEVVLPFRGVHSRWGLHHKQRFGRLVDRADRVEVLHTPGYEPWKLADAARACLARADLVLLLDDGRDAALRRALRAAREDARLLNLWGSWVRYGGLLAPPDPQDGTAG